MPAHSLPIVNSSDSLAKREVDAWYPGMVEQTHIYSILPLVPHNRCFMYWEAQWSGDWKSSMAVGWDVIGWLQSSVHR